MLDKVKVGGIEYEVNLVNLNTRKDDDIGKQLGWCIYSDNLIEVNSEIAIERQNQVFVHELVHAIFFEAGLEDVEDTVNRVGMILHQVLKDNDFSWLSNKNNKTVDENCSFGD